METLPVTLIVKAPNQQFEDQTIKCEPTWSIRKLKGYLSEVYPCNPTLEEQKLIYSGQLLKDSHILKDVLRQYEGQDTHTVHLVYTPKNRQFPTTTNKTTRKENAGTNGESIQHVNESQNQNHQQGPNLGSDGLRYRNNVTGVNTNQVPSSHNAPSNIPSPFIPGMANSAQLFMPTMGYTQINANVSQSQYSPEQYALAQQMAVQNMMHQMYIQYMNQYAASMQQSNPMSSSMNYFPQNFGMQQFGMNNMNIDQHSVRQQQEAPAPAAQPGRFQAAGDDDTENRDWLEILYTLSRLLVLLSLVYFYSSPGRCMIVILAFVLYYLYQNYQRNLRERQQTEPMQEPAAEADVVETPTENADAPNVNEMNENEIRNEPVIGQDREATTTISSLVESDESNRLPTITLLRTFISSFFSSLIPETPAV